MEVVVIGKRKQQSGKMKTYINKRSPIGKITLYLMGIVVMIIGILTILGIIGTEHDRLEVGYSFFGIGAVFFIAIEYYYRHYIHEIEFFQDRFRVTTKSLFGRRTEEGMLRHSDRLDDLFTGLKTFNDLVSKFRPQARITVTADGSFYIMESSKRWYILDTTYGSSAEGKIAGVIGRFERSKKPKKLKKLSKKARV
jgi:hypothetical protein